MSLKRLAIRSTQWSAAETIAVTAIQLFQFAILARVLHPKDFGLMALVALVISFAQLFEGMGIPEAVIQRAEPTVKELSSLYWFNLLMGAAAFGIVYVGAPAISRVFAEEQLTALVRVVGISLLISPLGMLFYALMRKELHFGLVAIANVSAFAVGALVALSAALLLSEGVWALVWGGLAHTCTRTLFCLIYARARHIDLHWHCAWFELKSYLNFGSFYVASMVANFFNARVDQLMIGGLLGATELGYYRIASQLTTEVVQKINPILTRVAFPVFVRLREDPARLKAGYLQLLRMLSLLNSPLYVGLIIVAPWAVPLIFGERWGPAIPLVQILAGYALIRAIGNASGGLILAYGRPDWSFRWNVGMLAVTPPVVYLVGLTQSMQNVAWSLFGLQCVLLLLVYRMIIRRIIGNCFVPFARSFGVPIVMALFMGGLIASLNTFIDGWSALSVFILDVILGGICYFSLVWFFQRQLVLELFGSWRVPPT